MNFTLHCRDVWGGHAQVNSLGDFFMSRFEEADLIAVDLTECKPNWTNNCIDTSGISKHLGKSLIHSNLLQHIQWVRSWTCYLRILDHFPIYLEMDQKGNKPSVPFKYITQDWIWMRSFNVLLKIIRSLLILFWVICL